MFPEEVGLDKVQHLLELTEDQDTMLWKSTMDSRSGVTNIFQFAFGQLGSCRAPDPAVQQELSDEYVSILSTTGIKLVQTVTPGVSERAGCHASYLTDLLYFVPFEAQHQWPAGHP